MTITEARVVAAEAVWNAIVRQVGNRRERLRPMINRFDPVGSTGDVDFQTRKRTVPTEKSEVSHVTLDGKDGNTWEQLLASELELNRNVKSYVKNDHLGFTIPYVHKGRSHSYTPDFLVRLELGDDGIVRTLVVEVSGSQKSPGPTRQKATTARDSWCVAVNNHGGFGRWGYIEMTDPLQFKARSPGPQVPLIPSVLRDLQSLDESAPRSSTRANPPSRVSCPMGAHGSRARLTLRATLVRER